VWEKWLGLVPLACIATAFYMTFWRPLVWDGLIIWEFKAHAAFLSGGHIPAAILSDPSRTSVHPTYPLALPLSELWFYLCAGHEDQSLVKAIFPPYYLAATVLLWGGVARKT